MRQITSPVVWKRILFVLWVVALLALVLPAASAQAGGVVSVCDEAHLLSALSGGGTVTFTCSGTIALTSTITISANTTIDGTVQAVTISGNNSVGVFKVNSGVTLTLNKLIIADGSATAGGGVFISSGTLTVSNSTFSGNRADLEGGAIYSSGGQVTVSDSTFSGNGSGQLGGGIYNDDGTLTVSRSSFTGNSAAQHGGGIASTGAASVSDSTFSGNHSGERGGAIVTATGPMTVGNSTFSGNNAPYGGGIANTNAGTLTVINSTLSGNSGCDGVVCLFGAITNDGATAILQNTIVANSVGYMNCDGYFSDGGGNLSYPDGSCPGINADPLLGALQDNGGPTQTMALGAGSPAIDAGNTAACQLAQISNHDQRGYARFVDGNGDGVAQCDVGAFEYGAVGPPTSVLDREPPEISIVLTPAEPDGANGWYLNPVTVKPEVTDASPVIDLRCALDPPSPPAAFDDLPEGPCPFLGGAEVTAEGRHTFYAAAMDIWGNKSAPVSASFKIDRPPLGLTNLEMTVNRAQAYAGAILEYKLMVRNLTPAEQAFAVTDPIPANTEIVRRISYNPATNAVEWSGVVEPWGFKTFTVYVRIASGTPGGTAIVNTAAIEDDAASGSASATTIVKMLPPYRGHRADVAVNEVVIRGN